MKTRTRLMGVLTAATLAFGMSGTVASAAAPETTTLTAPDASQLETATLPSSDSSPTASSQAVATCRFTADTDNFHVSSTPTSFGTISIHGTWQNIDCPAGTKADLTMHLEVLVGGKWVAVGQPGTKKGAYSGGGSANRVNARYDCKNGAARTYRAILDVDLQGIVDDSNKLITAKSTWNCG